MYSEQKDWQPIFIKKEEIELFKKNNPNIVKRDAFTRQIKELFFIDNLQFVGKDKEESYQTKEFKEYAETKAFDHVYVYYPWNFHLIKTVQENDYFKLKTNRNQDLITKEEQLKLRDFKVAVLGMSVGSNIAFVLTQAGISKEIILADFDELDTSNLNRILAGLQYVGVNKTFVAAAHIFEDNPFAQITTLSEGVNQENLEAQIKAGKVNCIVEEIDDIPFKITVRELAIKYKIPVVMVTDNGDGVVLHIERYDLGHTKIWGKDVNYFKENIRSGSLSKEEAGKIIMFDIVGGPDKVDPKMLASVKRVLARELISWSQLGSAAILGGVVATHAIKGIALETDTRPDVRTYITPTSVYLADHTS